MKKFVFHIFLFLYSSLLAQEPVEVSLAERIKSNLFVTVEADKTSTNVAEPIIVTYKLYSSLRSESAISKNPVSSDFEITGLEKNGTPGRETVDGVPFDVHTILKLQVIPTHAGKLTLSPIVVSNKIKLQNENGSKDPVLDGITENYSLKDGYYFINIKSSPLSVVVLENGNKNLQKSDSNLPSGIFEMNVQLSKKLFEPGEEGLFTIMILGTGSFEKINQPMVEWPTGIEVQPVKVDKKISKMTDRFISFTYKFKTADIGTFTISPVHFTFFDEQEMKPKTISSQSLNFNVVNEKRVVEEVDGGVRSETDGLKLPVLFIVIIILTTLLWLLFRKSKKRKVIPKVASLSNEQSLEVYHYLQPAKKVINDKGAPFFALLKQGLMDFLNAHFQLNLGSTTNEAIYEGLKSRQISLKLQEDISKLVSDLDMVIYGGGNFTLNKQEFLTQAEKLIASCKNIK